VVLLSGLIYESGELVFASGCTGCFFCMEFEGMVFTEHGVLAVQIDYMVFTGRLAELGFLGCFIGQVGSVAYRQDLRRQYTHHLFSLLMSSWCCLLRIVLLCLWSMSSSIIATPSSDREFGASGHCSDVTGHLLERRTMCRPFRQHVQDDFRRLAIGRGSRVLK